MKYQVRVRGVLGESILAAFPGFQVRTSGHDTVLVGDLPDQSALHGVLAQIEALGLALVEVRRVTLRGPRRAYSKSAGSDDYISSRPATTFISPTTEQRKE